MKLTKPAKIALALTWDGARYPITSVPPKAQAFLRARGHVSPSRREVTKLFADDQISEMRICWVPRLKGGDDVLANPFAAPNGRRIAFRAMKTVRFGDALGVVYRRDYATGAVSG
jgi:hypothetical protein